MDDTTSLMWAMLFGSIGMGYIVYGKRQHHAVALFCGIGLCVYPYFISGALLMTIVGISLMAVPKYLRI